MTAGPAPRDSWSAVDSILRPKSVVVVGASPQGRGFTAAPLKNLRRHGFEGDLYAVNPRYGDIDGIPCFPSVDDLPVVPDTAVVVVGARRVPDALEACQRLGVSSATVIAGGFAELGAEGAELERRIRAATGPGGVRLVGPNTAGLMNVVDGYVPRAALNHPESLPSGRMAVLTQSGALCNTLLNRVFANGLGLSYAVATGSQWDLDLWDFTDYCIADDRTRAVMTIVEGLKDPERFLAAARRAAAAGKPLVLLKPGRSELGGAAVQTHSGALSGAADVQLSLMRENGVIVVDGLDELWESAQLFERWGAPTTSRTQPWRVGIATYSGGDGALAVDAAEDAGLECPPPSADTARALDESFTLATAGNPFDFTGEVVDKPELIAPAASALVDDANFDVVLLAAPVWSGHFARWIVGPAVDAMAARPDRLTAVSLWSARGTSDDAEQLVREAGQPLFDGSQRAIRAIGRYADFARHFHAGDGWAGPVVRPDPVPAPHPDDGERHVLDYRLARDTLREAGVPFNEARGTRTVDGAVEAATAVGLPVTLKASSAAANHKAASGAVALYLIDTDAVRAAAEGMLHRLPDAELVVETYAPSVAMAMLGGQVDPEFGPVLVFGLGGGYAEAYRDVTHVRCPATPQQVHDALSRTTFSEVLGRDTDRTAAFVQTVAQVSEWFAGRPDVAAFDINPVLFDLDGSYVAVDARVEVFSDGHPGGTGG